MDFDKDRLKDMKDTVRNAVNEYAEERREDVDEIAEYGGGGPEGYAFAVLVLSERYEQAAELIDEDPETVEQDVGPIVDDLYDDAQEGREQASNVVEEALDIASPVIDAARNDPSSLPEAAEEAYQDAQRRLTDYAIESAMKQAEADLEDMLGGLEDGGDVEDQLGELLDEAGEDGGDLGDLFDEPDVDDDVTEKPCGTEDPSYEADGATDAEDVEYDTGDVEDAEDPTYETEETDESDADADAEEEDEDLDNPDNFVADPRNRSADDEDKSDDR